MKTVVCCGICGVFFRHIQVYFVTPVWMLWCEWLDHVTVCNTNLPVTNIYKYKITGKHNSTLYITVGRIAFCCS